MSPELVEEMARAGLDNKVFPLELSHAIAENCSRDESQFSVMQKTALHRYRTERSLYEVAPEYPEDVTVMENHFRFYDELYFFGLLTSRVERRDRMFRPYSVPYQGYTDTKYKKGSVPGNWVPKCYISIRKLTKPRNKQRRLVKYLSVLLHEMLHCFLWLFPCRDEWDRMKNPRYREEYGCKGHGISFLTAIYAIEKATQRLGHPRHLGLLLSLEENINDRMEMAGTLDTCIFDRIWLWDEKQERDTGIKKAQISSWGLRLSDLIAAACHGGLYKHQKWYQDYMEADIAKHGEGMGERFNALLQRLREEEDETLLLPEPIVSGPLFILRPKFPDIFYMPTFQREEENLDEGSEDGYEGDDEGDETDKEEYVDHQQDYEDDGRFYEGDDAEYEGYREDSDEADWDEGQYSDEFFKEPPSSEDERSDEYLGGGGRGRSRMTKWTVNSDPLVKGKAEMNHARID